jgi:DNA-directed RNA polymerase subunit RPC12/RpoP
MSEFKFACPVCGQHITADSSSSGGRIDCPTCYRKIIVPHAPTSGETKLILSATQADKPRPKQTLLLGLADGGATKKGRGSLFATIGLVLVLGGACAGAYVFRDKIFKPNSDSLHTKSNAAIASTRTYAVPTNISWTLSLTNKAIPETDAAGRIHGSGFRYEKAVLQGGHLTLRQGQSGSADLGVTVQFFALQGENLSGKTIEIAADRSPPLPKVVLRWKDEAQKAITTSIHGGYALKIGFGNAANGRMPGWIYLCLPDEKKSFVAGVFNAEIRKPSPPKPN